jgi:hypothetical protein
MAGTEALFLARFCGDGRRLERCTYLGGSKDDGAHLVLDGPGAGYLVGVTESDDFPSPGMKPTPRNGRDLFISKFTVR